MHATITRNYGKTADDKAKTLIKKLVFATLSVIVLVGLALGRREAVVVGAAVVITLAITLFASWAWGFTLNRVSLFALIFSIGILVDDAIVVVENAHRHMHISNLPLLRSIPLAVEEVGGPTILATFTVIAALLPMAFVTGLMGPYMAPIPINASMGMLISLGVAFIFTPWLFYRAFRNQAHSAEAHGGEQTDRLYTFLYGVFDRHLRPFLGGRAGRRRRLAMLGVVLALISISVALVGVQWVGAQDAAFRQQVGVPGGGRHAGGHAGRADPARARRIGPGIDGCSRSGELPDLCRHLGAHKLQWPGAAILPAFRAPPGGHPGQPGRPGAA
jgi:multidrug efflux pump subunit AcrB